jgi:hypothetical protein
MWSQVFPGGHRAWFSPEVGFVIFHTTLLWELLQSKSRMSHFSEYGQEMNTI